MSSSSQEIRRQEDTLLVEEVRSGRSESFGALMKRYEGLVRTSIWNLVRDQHLMDDLVQEIFAKAYEKLATLKEAGQFKVWVLRIARYHCLDHLRRKKVKIEDLEVLEAKGGLPKLVEPFVPIEDSMMTTLLEHLSPLDAELLWLRFVESLSYPELSEVTGLQEPAIRKRISRVLKRMREMVL